MIKFINIANEELGETFEPFVSYYDIINMYKCLKELLQENDFIVFYSNKSKQILDIEEQIKFDENYFVTELINNSLKKLVANTLYHNGKVLKND